VLWFPTFLPDNPAKQLYLLAIFFVIVYTEIPTRRTSSDRHLGD
jgi:hypothetical protein